MTLGLLGRTVAVGLATFLLVGVAVTELLQSRIEFSLFVGIPAGLVAGALAATLVARASSAGAPAQRRRLAGVFGAFAASFLLVLAAGVVLPLGTVVAILGGVGVGIVVAVASYLRPR